MQLIGKTFIVSQQTEGPMLTIIGLQKNGYYVEIKGKDIDKCIQEVELKRHGY